MAANTAPIFAAAVNGGSTPVQLTSTNGTNYATLYTAQANGSRVDQIFITSSDTSARVLMLAVNDGTTDHPIGEISVAAGSGTNGGTSPAVSGLNSGQVPALGQVGSLFLKAGWVLKVKSETAVTAAKAVDIVTSGGDY